MALERVAADYLAEVTHLLPRSQDNTLRKFPWHGVRPDLATWYHQPVERLGGGVQLGWPDLRGMKEWGDGADEQA